MKLLVFTSPITASKMGILIERIFDIISSLSIEFTFNIIFSINPSVQQLSRQLYSWSSPDIAQFSWSSQNIERIKLMNIFTFIGTRFHFDVGILQSSDIFEASFQVLPKDAWKIYWNSSDSIHYWIKQAIIGS